MKIKTKFKQWLIAWDQLIQMTVALFLEDGGWADETLSARAWRQHLDSKGWNWVRKTIDTIFFWEGSHCQLSYVSEQLRMQSPEEYRRSATDGID